MYIIINTIHTVVVLTSSSQARHHRKPNNLLIGSYSNVNKYPPADILEILSAPNSYLSRSYTSRRAGNTPPNAAATDSGSDGTVWTRAPGAFACDNAPCPNIAAGWWPTRYQRYWRTSALWMNGGISVSSSFASVIGQHDEEVADFHHVKGSGDDERWIKAKIPKQTYIPRASHKR